MLPTAIWTLVRTPAFWSAYARQTSLPEAIPELANARIVLPVPGAGALVVALDAHLDQHTLYLREVDGTETQLGWDDEAHWHPHALRWSEIDAVCGAAERVSRELVHPGLAILLLLPFCAITDNDPVDEALATIGIACRTLGLSVDTIGGIALSDFRGQRVRWTRDARGFEYPEQEQAPDVSRDLCSLRSPENPEFPFEALAALVARARAAASSA